MLATARMIISRLAPLTWVAAIGGIWLLPLRAVVVLTGVSVAGSTVRAAAATNDQMIAMLGRALADASRRDAHLLEPHLRQAESRQQARLGSPPAAR